MGYVEQGGGAHKAANRAQEFTMIAPAIGPGHTIVTPTPLPATSEAIDEKYPTSACLAAAYSACPGDGTRPAIEATGTILLQPCESMHGSHARATFMLPVALISMICCAVDDVVSSTTAL